MARYETNAVVLEFDASSLPIPEVFVRQLETLPWVNTVSAERTSIRLSVSDIPRAKQALIPLVLENHLVLERYQWVRPSLEDIFLQVSTSGGD
jgi:hypothetical protein